MSARASLIIVGGGEHARVVTEAARTLSDRWDVLGYVDVAESEATSRRLGLAYLGDDSVVANCTDVHLILGIGGSVALRSDVAARYGARAQWASIVHARAWVSPTAAIAPGSFISAGAVVNSGASVGAHSIVNTGAIVEHDVTIGSFTHVAPAAAVGGGAVIGERVHVGLGARIRDHVRIGDDALIGMGAVVVGDVEAGTRVIGVPAKLYEST